MGSKDLAVLLRTMKYFFVGSCLMFIVVMVRVPSNAKHPPSHAFELIICSIALANLTMAFVVRKYLVARVVETQADISQNVATEKLWITPNLFSLAMIESCALFALVLHLLGSSPIKVEFLFACAFLALFVWRPSLPENHGNGLQPIQ